MVLDMPLLDTRQKERDLTGVFIADLVLQILSYIAQTEREYNRQRQKEGIAIAKAKGTCFGRPPKDKPEIFPKILNAWQRKEISAISAGRLLGVAHQTYIVWAEEFPDSIQTE